MIFGPLGLLLWLPTSLISLAILGGGVYFIWGWYEGVLAGVAFLWGGIALVALSFLGRPIVLAMLGRRRQAADPDVSPPATSKFIEGPNGSRIYMERLGLDSGPTFVLTHGLSMDSTEWDYVKQSLAARYRLVTWDVPGFGKSELRGPCTMDTMAASLQAVVQAAGDSQVILVGHSMGGMITLTYCRLCSE